MSVEVLRCLSRVWQVAQIESQRSRQVHQLWVPNPLQEESDRQ